MRGEAVETALRRARARAETKQPRFQSAARRAIRSSLRTAATRFERLVTVHLTAAGDDPGWTPPADDELLTLDEIMAEYRGQTDPVRQAAVLDFFAAFGKAAVDGVHAAWDTTNPLIAAYLERTASQVTNIADTTRASIAGIVLRSYQDGLSVPDTAAAIRTYADSISASRAALIARTEFSGLVNGAGLEAVRIVEDETGVGYSKRWMTAPGAEYPRHEDYVGLDGQTVALDGLFDVGEDRLAYPGDPDGDPGEICNCRCTLEYVETSAIQGTLDAGPTQDELALMTNASPMELAVAAYGQAVGYEPAVTAALSEIARSTGGDLAGLPFRFKSEASLARKIEADAFYGNISNAESASRIKDALRYTFEFDTSAYSVDYQVVLEELRQRGFTVVAEKNKWDGTAYKGLNVNVSTPSGYTFEIQFHTPESLAAKEPGHLLYDEWRTLAVDYEKLDPTTDEAIAMKARLDELDAQMAELWRNVPDPPGVFALGKLG